MTGPDPARATADAIADRLTETILARYQGDSMTKQADPNGRTPIGPPPATLDEVQPPLYVQAMIETATAEGRAEALAEQLSDLSLDRMALVDRLVDREREAATVIVDLHVANARAVDEANQARALLSSATTRVDELQDELRRRDENDEMRHLMEADDPRGAELQTIRDTATTAITAIGGRNFDDIDTAGRVELLAERAIELYAANERDADDELREVARIIRLGIEAHHAAQFPHEDIGMPIRAVDQAALLTGYLAATRQRVRQLESANSILQDTANGRHSVVDGDVREHTEQAAEAAQREHQVLPTPSPASPCSNCGHTRAAHDPGAEWNADQAGIHRTCKPPCLCSMYVPVAPKPEDGPARPTGSGCAYGC
ncbi:hypothetical protein FDJ33_gp75 [Gordonia phage Brandonk123]|uniref:Uncharacterized protein n=1 Tax=Gordonia phage Brandonk123 TaxID=2079564 RepID=A0A2L0HJQ0_9CAUD|nr:hypothetical protein FDJ33_gp75 [Gordonia phage Brandonk123]AUX81911.1 hypothetical protein SEA_BRANDONK123_75 [Gordonia phage Brandonk123]